MSSPQPTAAGPDKVRAGFATLRSAVVVTPPGVDATRRTVRRRRRRTRAVATTLAVATILALALAGSALARTHQPNTVEAPPTPSVSASDPATPPPTAAGPVASGNNPPAAPPGATTSGPSSAAAPCTRNPEAQIADSRDGWITVAAIVDTLCPGQPLRVFWATYSYDTGGVQRLHRSAQYLLDSVRTSTRFQLERPANGPGICGESWYVGYGDLPVAATIAPGADPYGTAKLLWNRNPDAYPCST